MKQVRNWVFALLIGMMSLGGYAASTFAQEKDDGFNKGDTEYTDVQVIEAATIENVLVLDYVYLPPTDVGDNQEANYIISYETGLLPNTITSTQGVKSNSFYRTPRDGFWYR